MVLGTSLASSTREALPNSDSIIKEPIQAVVGTLALPLTLMPGSGSFVPGILPDQAQFKFTQLDTKFWIIFGSLYSSSCSAIRAAVPSFNWTKVTFLLDQALKLTVLTKTVIVRRKT